MGMFDSKMSGDPGGPLRAVHALYNNARALARGARGEAIVIDLCIWGCATFTWGAMTAGLANLSEGPGFFNWAGAAIFSGIIAMVLTISIRRFFTEETRRARCLAFAAWSICAAISVLLGFGAWFQNLSSARLGSQQADYAARTIIEPMVRFQASYELLSTSATAVADHSRKMASIEEKQGGTCGAPSSGLQGPRFRFRQLDQETYANFARHFESQNAKITSEINAAKLAASQFSAATYAQAVSTIRQAADTARAAAADPVLARWNSTATQRLAQGQGLITDPLTGEVFVCPDPTLTATLSAAASVQLPGLPTRLPEITAPTLSSSVRRGISLLQGDTPFDPALDTMPFGIGAALDVIIFLLAWLRGTSLRGSGGTRNARPSGGSPSRLYGAFADASLLGPMAGQIDKVLSASGWRLIELLAAHAIEEGEDTHIIQPVRPSRLTTTELKRAIWILKKAGDLKFRFRAMVDQLPVEWQEFAGAQMPQVIEVAVYRIKTRALADMELDWARHVAPPSADLQGIFFTSRTTEDA